MAEPDVEKEAKSEFKPKKWRQFLPALIASNGTLMLGMIMGWSSPALPTLVEEEFGQVTTSQKSWITSLALLGAFFSGLPGCYLLNKLGPRKLMMWLCPLLLVGWLQIYYANSIRMFYFGRFILGFAAGPYMLAVPVYIAEVSTEKLRAHLSGFTLVQFVHGFLFAYIKGALTPWKYLSMAMAGLPIAVFIAFYFLPEAPGFLFSQNKEAEATDALKWFRGATDVVQIESEIKLLKATRMENSGTVPKMKLKDWLGGPIRKPLLICLLLMLIKTWSGIWIIIMYTVDIFNTASILDPQHKLPLSSNLSTILVGVAFVLGVTVSGLLIKKTGTKILLIVSSIMTALCWILLGLFFYFKIKSLTTHQPSADGLEYIPLIAMIFMAFFYNLGLGTVPYLILAQFIPYNLLGAATAIATTFNWFAAFILIQTYQNIASAIGPFIQFWIFALISLMGALYAHFVIPKTNVKDSQETLKDIDEPSISTSTSRM